jgi:alkanesulfonate monooxygenase SsuD/methylene tetrahydromethanopterin reductase-like flavin-dependent oxidoreductase (luciferase family)
MPEVGLFLIPEPATPVDTIIGWAKRADEQGFDSVWLGDHLIDYKGGDPVAEGPPDSFTTMTAIAAVTTRIKLAWGTLNPSFRNPAVLAKMLATLDQISHGRVICSFGAGWLKPEYEQYDVPFIEDHDERIAHEREVIELVKQLWTHPGPERVTYEGRWVRAKELGFNPAPYQKPHPPIWVGGDSPATLALAQELGDGWIPLSRGELDTLRELRADPAWPSRPFTVARVTRIIVGDSFDAVRHEVEAAYEVYKKTATLEAPPTFEDFASRHAVGSVDDVLAKLAEYEEVGVTHHLAMFDDEDQQERCARLVLPRLHEVAAVASA